MSRSGSASRRSVLKAAGGLVGVGVLGMLAGCGDGGGGDGGSGDGGTPTETDSGDLEAVSIGGTQAPSNETASTEATETAETTGTVETTETTGTTETTETVETETTSTAEGGGSSG